LGGDKREESIEGCKYRDQQSFMNKRGRKGHQKNLYEMNAPYRVNASWDECPSDETLYETLYISLG